MSLENAIEIINHLADQREGDEKEALQMAAEIMRSVQLKDN